MDMSSFSLKLRLQTMDSSEHWEEFYLKLHGDALGTEASPKKIAQCSTIEELFRAFMDASDTGMSEDDIREQAENGCYREEYQKIWEEICQKDFWKFADKGKVHDFLRIYGERSVSDVIAVIEVQGIESYRGDMHCTTYTYYLETGKYVKTESGAEYLDCEDSGGWLCASDESEIDELIEDYDESDIFGDPITSHDDNETESAGTCTQNKPELDLLLFEDPLSDKPMIW